MIPNEKPLDPDAEAAAEFAETFGEAKSPTNRPFEEAKSPFPEAKSRLEETKPQMELSPIQKLEMAAALLGLEVNQLANVVLSAMTQGSKAAGGPPTARHPYVPKGSPKPGAPPMPEVDPRAGDKTAALVEWYRAWWPEEYENRYADRKTHLEDRRGAGARAMSSTKGFVVDDPLAFTTQAEAKHGMKSEIPHRLIDPADPRVI